MSDSLEVTWTPATCDGLPPVGTLVAVNVQCLELFRLGYPVQNDANEPRWWQTPIASYCTSEDRPIDANGSEPWVQLTTGAGNHARVALKHCVLLGIEKQPDGWPHHNPDAIISLERDVRQRYNIDEDTFAHMLRTWLKDRGCLKK